MTAAVFCNTLNKDAICIANKAEKILETNSINCISFVDKNYMPDAKLFSSVDFCVVVGGDGTIIKYAKDAAMFGKPVIGVNAGRLGYLADIEPDNLEALIKIAKGDFKVEERVMLKAEVVLPDGSTQTNYCVNDAVISRGNESNMLDIFIDVNNERFSYRADGLIFATPTGSTAYSLSAGGPVVSPEVQGIIMSPICSHSLNSRPVVFSPDTIITSGIFEHFGSNASVSFDWDKRISLSEGTKLIISAAEFPLKLIRINGQSFYKRLFAKFK